MEQGAVLTDKEVPFKDSVILRDTLLPAFEDSTKHYFISGKVQPAGIHFYKIAFYDTVTLRIVEKKTGPLARRETVIQTVHSNPHYVTFGIQSIIVQERPNAWNSWIKPALFLGAGMLIQSRL